MLKKLSVLIVIGTSILNPFVEFTENIVTREQTSSENFQEEVNGNFFEEQTVTGNEVSETTEDRLPILTVKEDPGEDKEPKLETEITEGKEITIESNQQEKKEDGQEVLETDESIYGTWGTVPWAWDPATKTIELGVGNAGTAVAAPWRVHNTVVKIMVKDIVVFPSNSEGMFGSSVTSGLKVPLEDLKTIVNAGNIDVSGVTNMSYMFSSAKSLTELDVSSWDVSNVTNMSYMFSSARSLTELDVSSWDVSSVTNMYAMFSGLSMITGLDVSNWDVSNATNMGHMFSGLSKLTELDVSRWDVSNVTNMASMFSGTSSLTDLDVLNWDVSSVINMYAIFNLMRSLSGLDVSNWDVSSVTDMRFMFSGMRSLTGLDVSNWDVSSVTYMNDMFSGVSSLTDLDVSNWDVSNVTGMGSMFNGMSSLTGLDVSNWDVSSVTNMGYMFSAASSLTDLDVSNWDVSNVTNMGYMFSAASSLTDLDVSNWDVSNVANMSGMFNRMYNLRRLDMYSFNMQNVTTMRGMFTGTKLEKLILGSDNKFLADADLGVPYLSDGTPAEKWIRINGTNAVSPTELMNSFGNGDLIAGTYIAEKEQLSISHFDPVGVSIGDEIYTTFNLDLNLYTTTKENGSIFKIYYILPSENLVEYGSSVEVGILDSNEQVLETIFLPITLQKNGFTVEMKLSAEQLSAAKTINVVASGRAWNNTSGMNSASLEVEYPVWGGENVEVAKLTHKINHDFEITNGPIKIQNFPDQLNFDIKKLSNNLNGTLIDLKTNNFSVSILDYRGTNALSQTDSSVARQDWELFLTAEDFIDQKNNVVSSDTMSLVYIKDGQNHEILSSDEVKIYSHSVQGETAKDNHLHELSWKDEEGLKVHVKNKNNLKANQIYQSTVTFELRQAP